MYASIIHCSTVVSSTPSIIGTDGLTVTPPIARWVPTTVSLAPTGGGVDEIVIVAMEEMIELTGASIGPTEALHLNWFPELTTRPSTAKVAVVPLVVTV